MELSMQTPSHDACYTPKPNHHMDNLQSTCPQTGSRSLELFTCSKITKRVEERTKSVWGNFLERDLLAWCKSLPSLESSGGRWLQGGHLESLMCVPAFGKKSWHRGPWFMSEKATEAQGQQGRKEVNMGWSHLVACPALENVREEQRVSWESPCEVQRAMGDGEQSPEKQKAKPMFWECGRRSPAEWPPVSLREHLCGKEWLWMS